tara:strand:+ start:86 stop:355 length:270 start_codon:yes stop_codon:yes gene_type:complete
MINRWQTISTTQGHNIEFKTLIYAYPLSSVLLNYNVGFGDKTHHLKIGFTSEGRWIVKSKNRLHKTAKELLRSSFVPNAEFINLKTQTK